MKKWTLLLAIAGLGCNNNSDNAPTNDAGTDAVIATDSSTNDAGDSSVNATVRQAQLHYATLAEAQYGDALSTAQAMQTAITAFLTNPTADTLTAARNAWTAARVAYRSTEGYRFYGGPIDDPNDEREGAINAWPVDESYIDYVAGTNGQEVARGMINLAAEYPVIDANTIREANGRAGEDQVMTGFHAIEFLLWGQDQSDTGPGARPFSDYVVSTSGHGMTAARRAQYLRIVTEMLITDLTTVHSAWIAERENYRATFAALNGTAALCRMFTGIATLSGFEAAGERLRVAYERKDQEQEHSCFSDTTNGDTRGNIAGVRGIYLGTYTRTNSGNVTGTSLSDVVRELNPALDTRIRAELTDAVDKAAMIPDPFDQAFLGADTAPGRVRILATIEAFETVSTSLVEAARLVGVTVDIENPACL